MALLSEGCAERRPRAYPWATAIHVKPRTPTPAPGYKPPPIDDSAPDLSWDFAPQPSKLVVIRQPARPRVAVQATQEPTGTSKTETPLLAPQLSEQEVAAAQQQMNERESRNEILRRDYRRRRLDRQRDRPGIGAQRFARRAL